MMHCQDAQDLATRLHCAAQDKLGKRMTFELHPSQMWAAETHRAPAPVPMLTSHGDASKLAQIIHTYHQWGQPIHIGVYSGDGLFQFWVEQDDTE